MNWDDLRILLAVARTGGLLPAARKLGVDHTTVSRRLSALEAEVGRRLFDRSPRGATLTVAGAAVAEHAERAEIEVLAIADRLGGGEGAAGVVRLATPEAFGAFLVAPAAADLRAKHPALELELVPEARAVNLSKREADLAVTLAAPTHGRLVAQKLGDYRLGLFASRDYLARRGGIASAADLTDQDIVWYVDDLLDVPELRFLDEIVGGASVAFRSTSIAAQQAAVAAGIGVGMLHLFSARQDPRLVRVLEHEISVVRSYWLVMHADQRRTPRVRAVADFLVELMKARRAEL